MIFKTTQSNRLKPASYEPKPFPKQKVWMHSVIHTKTGGYLRVGEFTLIIFAIVFLLTVASMIRNANKHVTLTELNSRN